MPTRRTALVLVKVVGLTVTIWCQFFILAYAKHFTLEIRLIWAVLAPPLMAITLLHTLSVLAFPAALVLLCQHPSPRPQRLMDTAFLSLLASGNAGTSTVAFVRAFWAIDAGDIGGAAVDFAVYSLLLVSAILFMFRAEYEASSTEDNPAVAT